MFLIENECKTPYDIKHFSYAGIIKYGKWSNVTTCYTIRLLRK